MWVVTLRQDGEGHSRLRIMSSNLARGRQLILAPANWTGATLMRPRQEHPGRGLTSEAELDRPAAQGRMWS
jgi:hypothetical protein